MNKAEVLLEIGMLAILKTSDLTNQLFYFEVAVGNKTYSLVEDLKEEDGNKW